MARDSYIERELARLRADYSDVLSEPFEHFYCPILYVDEDAELCLGHVVNESIPNSSRRCVLQRKDVDGFFGSLVESEFVTVLEAKGKSVDDILENPKLRQKVPLKFEVDGKSIEAYEVKDHASNSHPRLHIQKSQGDFLTFAMKVSHDDLPASAKLQITYEGNYSAVAIASLMKAAHLTMFALFGYHYVNSAAGVETARILRTFFLSNRQLPRRKQLSNVENYFSKFAGMVMPWGVLRATLCKARSKTTDSWFAWEPLGSSSRWECLLGPTIR